MRRTRWLILAAIIFITFTVISTYFAAVERARRDAPPPAKPLSEGVEGTAESWHYRHNEGGCPVFEARAKKFEQAAQQMSETGAVQLEDVAIRLFHQCGKTSDEVASARAQYDSESGVMYSDGEVRITMGVPADDDPPDGRLMKIISSGVRFDTKTGRATTEREAKFNFDRGDGSAVGAEYDPNLRELHLKSQVSLNWRGTDTSRPPMHIETSDVVYRERGATVSLGPWARLTRDTLTMNSAGPAIVTLQKGVIRAVEAKNATGVQDEPGRKVEYSADVLNMVMDEKGQVTRIDGTPNAHLVSTSDTGKTNVTSDRAVMDFTPGDHESTLTTAAAMGHAVVESTPIAKPGAAVPDTRVLKSDTIYLHMRAGGREIDNVETAAAGTLDFIPNAPGKPRRLLTGDRMWIAYGPNNAIDNFRSIAVQTRTDNPPRKPGEKRAPTLTWSKDLLAHFDPKTQQLSSMEQNNDFRYQEGDRNAKADKASLDQVNNTMTLIGSARFADQTGSTTADKIVMNQKNSDVNADGHVNSIRLPDKKQDSNPALLSSDQPMQAKADKMTTAENNSLIHYEGNAVAWQGGNRVEAERIDFDRDNSTMRANGKVVSQFVDKAKAGKDGKPTPVQSTNPVYTIVHAPSMVYTDEDRIADYTGGAVMNRPNLTVKAREIKAYLKDANSDSSLDKAIADGSVAIDQKAPGRTRTGTSEHAEYFTADQKIILTGGQPEMIDSVKGTTKGRELTYFANDDRLLVNGLESQRSESAIRRKK
jgi:LPS export ABC transporter protein LptC/lipopolysaccharide transport protein LptA